MALYRSEGVVLQAHNFQDYDKIVTCFTRDQGMIKFIVKQGNRPKNGLGLALAPLAHVEVVFFQGKTEIAKCNELNLLNAHLDLRGSFAILDAGCEMAQTLMKTQVLYYPAPALYALFIYYLKKLPKILDPQLLMLSFKLKLLRHEGLFPSDEILYGQFQEDVNVINLLAYCRTLSELSNLSLSSQLRDRIVEYLKSVH